MSSPCKTCPWRHGSPKLTETGNGDPTHFIGQAFGPFWLPCHNSKGYEQDRRDPSHKQCVGAAMFRDLNGYANKLPEELLKHLGDPQIVLSTPAEFLAHHGEISPRAAETYLERNPPMRLFLKELVRQGVALQEVSDD